MSEVTLSRRSVPPGIGVYVAVRVVVCCGGGCRPRKGEVFAYVGSIQNLKDLKGVPAARE